jgi:3-deoxy-D-manno-octulosonic-acid transferase
LRSLFADVLARGVRIAAQTDADAERFKALGASDVQVTGNIKFDIEIPEAVRAAGATLRAQFGKRFVWVAGSTHPGEEDAALQTHRRLLEQHRDALLVLVPRHPQRFEEVRQLLDKSGLSFVSRSSGAGADSVSVLLVDTMGELLSFYAAADLAFVGGSLVPVGGHNLLEPASFGVATLCGPYMSNAQDVVDRFRSSDGVVQVSSAEKLGDAVLTMANDLTARAELGARGRDVVEGNRGAVIRTLDLIDLR